MSQNTLFGYRPSHRGPTFQDDWFIQWQQELDRLCAEDEDPHPPFTNFHHGALMSLFKTMDVKHRRRTEALESKFESLVQHTKALENALRRLDATLTTMSGPPAPTSSTNAPPHPPSPAAPAAIEAATGTTTVSHEPPLPIMEAELRPLPNREGTRSRTRPQRKLLKLSPSWFTHAHPRSPPRHHLPPSNSTLLPSSGSPTSPPIPP